MCCSIVYIFYSIYEDIAHLGLDLMNLCIASTIVITLVYVLFVNMTFAKVKKKKAS